MKALLFTLYIFVSTNLFAQESIALILSTEGIVKVKDGIRKHKASRGVQLSENNLLLTSKNSSAVVGMRDGSKVVLDANSILKFVSNNELQQKSGAAYYEIASRDVKNRLKVSTDFAIIGIKGTKFIVNADKTKNLLLKEGKVGVASPSGKFSLYKDKEMSEYELYKAKMQKDFDEYKASQEREFIAFVKEFDLSQGRMVSFDKSRADNTKMNQDAKKQFKHFEKLLHH